MPSLLEKLEKLRSDITEIMDEIRNQNQADEPVPAKIWDGRSSTLENEMALGREEYGRRHQGPVAIMDEKGVYPNALDRAVEEQRSYYARGYGPSDGPNKVLCSEDGCNRTEDCGPFCRNRN